MILKLFHIQILFIGLLISLILPIQSHAQDCSSTTAKVGNSCTGSGPGGRASTGASFSGYCARANQNSDAANNPLSENGLYAYGTPFWGNLHRNYDTKYKFILIQVF